MVHPWDNYAECLSVRIPQHPLLSLHQESILLLCIGHFYYFSPLSSRDGWWLLIRGTEVAETMTGIWTVGILKPRPVQTRQLGEWVCWLWPWKINPGVFWKMHVFSQQHFLGSPHPFLSLTQPVSVTPPPPRPPPSPVQRSWGFLAEAGSEWLSCTSGSKTSLSPHFLYFTFQLSISSAESWNSKRCHGRSRSLICVNVLSCFHRVRLCATPWTVALQAPLCVGFFRQEYWSGLPCPPLGIFPTQGLNPCVLHLLALAGGFFTTSATAHLVDRYLLSTYYDLGTSADAGVSAGNEQR